VKWGIMMDKYKFTTIACIGVLAFIVGSTMGSCARMSDDIREIKVHIMEGEK